MNTRAAWRRYEPEVDLYVSPCGAIDLPPEDCDEREVRIGLAAFLRFVRGHKELYRIIDEAEFVDHESFRRHYEGTAERIGARLKAAAGRGEVRDDVSEVHAWAVMGSFWGCALQSGATPTPRRSRRRRGISCGGD